MPTLNQAVTNYPEKIVESCTDLIFALDGDGIIRYVNRKIEEFGYSRDEIIGKEFSSLMIRDGKTEDPSRMREGVKESISRFILREKSGGSRKVEATFFPLKGEAGQGGVARDIAPGSHAEKISTRTLPAGFAHDVKSPLAAMKLSLSILEKTANEDDLPILNILNEKLIRLQEMMQKLLDLILADGE